MTESTAVRVQLANYPHLEHLMLIDKGQGATVLRSALELADYVSQKRRSVPRPQDVDFLDYVRQRFPEGLPDEEEAEDIDGEEAEEEIIFGMKRSELADQVIEALTDYRGILQNHHSRGEAKALEVLKHDANPLQASRFFTIDGKKISQKEFFGEDKPDIKGMLQGLLYAGRYLSHVDLVKYLMLSDFHMVEHMQNEHIQALLQIQPALKYQQENNITIGKRVEGTGFFDLGDEATKARKDCPACKSEKWNTKEEDYAFCPSCYGGGLK